MAIFSKNKTESSDDVEAKAEVVSTDTKVEKKDKKAETTQIDFKATGMSIVPRVSEKALAGAKNRQYIFVINKKTNKLSLARALEAAYGVKVESVNIINVKGKMRRFGRTVTQTSGVKKAIVTLTKDSKRPGFFEVI